MKPGSLRDLYLEELRDLFDAEQQILQALPKMEQAASDAQLKRAFSQHHRQTEGHVRRLEQIFERLGEKTTGKKCKGLAGIVSENEELIRQGGEPDTLDAGLIGGAQKVEHYEMAGYGTVRTWARLLGEQDAAQLLQQTLDEEGETDKLLTQLAESRLNREATGKRAAA
jgi:ferritin-like metal-binding protein YciE